MVFGNVLEHKAVPLDFDFIDDAVNHNKCFPRELGMVFVMIEIVHNNETDNGRKCLQLRCIQCILSRIIFTSALHQKVRNI